MITQEDVIQAYTDWNGTEAAEEAFKLCPLAFQMTAKYLDDYEYDKDDDRYLNTLATTLDVLRKAYDGDFQGIHADGDYRFEYCNAAELHVAENPKHKVVVEYVTVNSFTSLEVRCEEPEEIPNGDGSCTVQPHWWDHVA